MNRVTDDFIAIRKTSSLNLPLNPFPHRRVGLDNRSKNELEK